MTSIISLAISAWLQSRYNAHHNYPSISLRDRNTFTLFTSVWTIVFNLIFVALFLRASTRGSILASVASHFIIFFLTWIFWLAAAASLTAPLSGMNCSYVERHNVTCFGANDLIVTAASRTATSSWRTWHSHGLTGAFFSFVLSV